jgi:hypothetical protein
MKSHVAFHESRKRAIACSGCGPDVGNATKVRLLLLLLQTIRRTSLSMPTQAHVEIDKTKENGTELK